MRKNKLRNYSQFANLRDNLDQTKTRHASSGVSDNEHRLRIISAYGKWIEDWENEGLDLYFVTFVFRQLPELPNDRHDQRSRHRKRDLMFEQITWVHGRLVNKTTKKHRSKKWSALVPRGVFFADLPRNKSKNKLNQVGPNNGLHVHGVIGVSRLGRIREPLDEHFASNRAKYLIRDIREIDIRPIKDRAKYATEYGAKALKRPSFSADDVLVLPRPYRDLFQKKSTPSDPIKDLHAGANFSEETAKLITENPNVVLRLLGDRYKN